MFSAFLFSLRTHGLKVGLNEWMAFLTGLRRGIATDLDGLYGFGRSVLCRTEADYDSFDQAFGSFFEGRVLTPEIREELLEWLSKEVADKEKERVEPDFANEDLFREFLKRLAEQTEEHHGGNYWVGTGGTSPFGHSGNASRGIRVGKQGGGRRAINVASERRWENYRNDRVLDVRDLQVVLRALRSLTREGALELDIDETIAITAKNGGDIELVEQRSQRNELRLVLLMDVGGSMQPHADKVERLFSAASKLNTFRSFDTLYFHNCVYSHLYKDVRESVRVSTADVLGQLTPKHRLIFVGDASMAPYELFSSMGWYGQDSTSGIDWLHRFKRVCPASVWLNPDPPRWWDHPTVEGIAGVFDMFELTVEGVRDAVKRLRHSPI